MPLLFLVRLILVRSDEMLTETSGVGIEDHPQTGRIIELVDPWYDVGSNEIEDRLSIRLSWTTVCERFQSLYCNWDPETFDTSEALHLQVNSPTFLATLQLISHFDC